MAHIHKKMKKGRPYYYVRETARVNGKSKVVSQIYLGSAERIVRLVSGAKGAECAKLAVEEYGVLAAAKKPAKSNDLESCHQVSWTQ